MYMYMYNNAFECTNNQILARYDQHNTTVKTALATAINGVWCGH